MDMAPESKAFAKDALAFPGFHNPARRIAHAPKPVTSVFTDILRSSKKLPFVIRLKKTCPKSIETL